jgi:hypothetical protein
MINMKILYLVTDRSYNDRIPIAVFADRGDAEELVLSLHQEEKYETFNCGINLYDENVKDLLRFIFKENVCYYDVKEVPYYGG